MLSDIFIFVNILKLHFCRNFEYFWQSFGKIQSLGPIFLQNFSRNIDEIFGAATLQRVPRYFFQRQTFNYISDAIFEN